MKAVDTNVLVYATIAGGVHHHKAQMLLQNLAEGDVAWAIPWPCIYEFLRVVTHPKIFSPPMPVAIAHDNMRGLLDSPSLNLLSETPQHAAILGHIIQESGVSGNLMHDAHIFALCVEHGVTEFFTGDADFSKFRGVEIRNPFRP